MAKRITEYAREHMHELDPTVVTRNVMVPLWSQDPSVLVLAMVNTEGTVVGHAVAAINSDGVNSWLNVTQTQADGAVGDAVKRSLDFARQWAQGEINGLLTAVGRKPVSRMCLVTGKNEKAWEREFGFKLERRVLALALDGEESTSVE